MYHNVDLKLSIKLIFQDTKMKTATVLLIAFITLLIFNDISFVICQENLCRKQNGKCVERGLNIEGQGRCSRSRPGHMCKMFGEKLCRCVFVLSCLHK